MQRAIMNDNHVFDCIWKLDCDVRCMIGGDNFKNYVLMFMFYRYLCEHMIATVGEQYATEDEVESTRDKERITETLGYFIRPRDLFVNVLRRESDNDAVEEVLRNALANIAENANGVTRDIINAMFCQFGDGLDGMTMKSRRAMWNKLMRGVAGMPSMSHDRDVFGDAYEFMMGMYSTNGGKAGGEYYTPPSVSELVARLATQECPKATSAYDPTCGSGSLLLSAARHLHEPKTARIVGQELQSTTRNLCRVNMMVHNIAVEQFDIAQGDTLTNPQCGSETFDCIVSNPPFSVKWDGKDDPALVTDPRFAPAGSLAPKSKADLAFVMHSLYHLKDGGVAAIVCFPGTLYRTGAERDIRRYLVDHHFVDGVVSLPGKLFYGTTITTDILIVRKAPLPRATVFIDAKDEFVKDGKFNALDQTNISNILGWYAGRQQVDERVGLADSDQIASTDYNLTVGMYIQRRNDLPDVDIKRLNDDIAKLTERNNILRDRLDRAVQMIADVEVQRRQWRNIGRHQDT